MASDGTTTDPGGTSKTESGGASRKEPRTSRIEPGQSSRTDPGRASRAEPGALRSEETKADLCGLSFCLRHHELTLVLGPLTQ